MITTNWVDNELDGLGAMVATWNSDEEVYNNKLKGIESKLTDFTEIQDIIKYNEIDCKVLWDIRTYILSLY